MNKSPIDEMNEILSPDLEANRKEALETLHFRTEALNQDIRENQELPDTSDNTPSSTTSTTSTSEEPTEEKELNPEIQQRIDDLEKVNDPKYYLEKYATIPTGVADTAIGGVNLLTAPLRDLGVPEIPRIPKFQHNDTQLVREISSVIIPSIVLGNVGVAGGTAAQAKWGAKLGKLGSLGDDVAFKWFAKTGVGAGTGAVVDLAAVSNETDHNLAGTLKKTWPQTYGWISTDFATLDEDSPELKRQKNMKEGVMLSLFADVIAGGAKILQSKQGVAEATRWLPENEKAKQTTQKLNKELTTTPEEVFEKSAKRRTDAVKEAGDYNLSKSVDLDQPIFGIHDVYDDMEYAMRTEDPGGIFGASVDLVRIENNIDTVYGRLGSVFTENALKYGLDADEGATVLIKGLADQLTDAGPYGYKTSNGRYLSFAQIDEAGERLAADLMNMDVAAMKQTLKKLSGKDVDSGAEILNSEAYNGVFKAINRYLKEYASMDQAKAFAYASTSVGGQVSDMAEGVRLMEGSVAVQNAQEQILDRLEFLMAAKAQTSYVRGRALNMTNLWNRTKIWTKDKLQRVGILAEAELDDVPAKMREKALEAKKTVETLRNINKERPEMLGPLMLAYEMTDGKINTMYKLNNYVRNSTGTLSKAFFDVNSDIPSAWTQGVWANIYNSVLSSLVTPLKAGASNAVLLIERPVATFIGAALPGGDKKTIRRAVYQYRAFGETFTKAWSHMNEVYKRAAKDPSKVGYIMRDDIARRNEQQMELLNAYADSQSQLGNDGPAAMVAHIEELNALSDHPWLRFGTNAMSAFDGFTRSVIGNIEARGRAFDMVNAAGDTFNEDMIDDLAKRSYEQMFDKNGIITDKAVEYASREISMNLDNAGADALGELMRDAPAFKPFMMFPRTSTNMLLFAGSHSPLGLLPAQRFQEIVHKFSVPFEKMARGQVEELLTARGLSFDDTNIEAIYNNLRAEMRGRKAIGALAVTTAGAAFMLGNLRGTGHYDKETQRTRRDVGWQPKTFKGLDGRWYSYDNLGPVTDWLALTADVMDNIVDGTLDENTGTAMLQKSMFVLSSSITSKSVMAGLEPMNDVLSGNGMALARWGASFGSGLVPLSGLRNDFSRLLTPQLKELDQELGQLIANRNPILKDTLPDKHDYIDGSLIGVPDDPFTRIWNTFSPWKVSDKISDEKQFLIDVEFDGRPTLNTDGNGVRLTPEQKAAIAEYMGREGTFKREIQQIMRETTAQRFRKDFKVAQRANSRIDVSDYQSIHIRLKDALRASMEDAISNLAPEMKQEIQNKRWIQQEVKEASKRGDIETIRNYNNYQ